MCVYNDTGDGAGPGAGETDGDEAAGGQKSGSLKNAIAQIGLGGRAEPGDGAGPGQGQGLRVLQPAGVKGGDIGAVVDHRRRHRIGQ